MRILIATIGSLGDLHPYMALALGLRERGHIPILAAPAMYRERVEATGLAFAPLGPESLQLDPETYAKILHPRKGAEFTFRDLLMPAVTSTYEDLLQIIDAHRPDLFVNSPVIFAAPLIAEKLGIPWVSTVLAPASFFSIYEPPALPGAPAAFTRGPKFLVPWWGRAIHALGQQVTRNWSRPIADLRRTVGLPPFTGDPLYEGQHSPRLVLAMFSKALGTPQPDWPPQTVQTGFCFYDGHEPLDPGITQYLDEGPAPILFTLGSTAVNAAGNFYEESAEAARILGRRALLLAGKNPVKGAFAYAPYSEVFPRAAVIVHQAGVGTTAQALRSGVPSLIVPFNFDQPDNAARVADRGAALVLSQSRYNAKSAAAKLRVLLEDQSIRAKAQSIAQDLLQEDGVAAACAALEPRP